MKVKKVTVLVLPEYGVHNSTFEYEEGVSGIVDLHYIVRDGMVCVNYRREGSRHGISFPMHRVLDVLTSL